MTLALEAIPDFGHYPQLSLEDLDRVEPVHRQWGYAQQLKNGDLLSRLQYPERRPFRNDAEFWDKNDNEYTAGLAAWQAESELVGIFYSASLLPGAEHQKLRRDAAGSEIAAALHKHASVISGLISRSGRGKWVVSSYKGFIIPEFAGKLVGVVPHPDVSQARLTPLVETSSSAVGILPDTLELIPNPIHVQSMHQDYSRNLSVV
jgi:hypothetical protein